MFTRPDLKVARYDNACQVCRTKRRRCVKGDGDVCLLCRKLRVPCVYNNSMQKVEIQYHTYLEQAIKKVTEELEGRPETGSSPAGPLTAESAAAHTAHTMSVPLGTDAADDAEKDKDDRFVEHFESDIGALPLRASSQQAYLDRSGILSFTDVVLASAGLFHNLPSSTCCCVSDDLANCTSAVCDCSLALPPEPELKRLLDHYFRYVWPLYPVLSRPDLMRQIQNLQSSALYDSFSYDVFTVFIVLATASFAMSEESLGRKLLKHALCHVRHLVLQTLSGLQATLLLIGYGVFDHQIFEIYHLLATAMRTCMELGLHKETSFKPKSDSPYVDRRRRLFWCAYSMDRIYSMCLGVTFDMAERSIETSLGDEVSPIASPPSTGPAAYADLFAGTGMPLAFVRLVQIRRIQAHCYGTKALDFDQVSQKLEQWKRSLTDPSDPLLKAFTLLLQLEFHFTKVLMLRNLPGPNFQAVTNNCIAYCNSYKSLRPYPSNFVPHLMMSKLYIMCYALIAAAWDLPASDDRMQDVLITSNEYISFISSLSRSTQSDLELSVRLKQMFATLVRNMADKTIERPPAKPEQLPVRHISKGRF